MEPEFFMIADGPEPVAPCSHAVESDGWVILTESRSGHCAAIGPFLAVDRVLASAQETVDLIASEGGTAVALEADMCDGEQAPSIT